VTGARCDLLAVLPSAESLPSPRSFRCEHQVIVVIHHFSWIEKMMREDSIAPNASKETVSPMRVIAMTSLKPHIRRNLS
jgi:hypothetical protein